MQRSSVSLALAALLALGACGQAEREPGERDVAAPPPAEPEDATREPDVGAAPPVPTRGAEDVEPSEQGAVGDAAEAARDAGDLVQQASTLLDRMQQDPELAQLLARARGVFLVPNYGSGAAIVGARGGEGLLLARSEGGWSGPAFYDIGSISVGAQAGAAGGAIAMLLMNDAALDRFRDENQFSLSADAGITVVDYSARAEADAGEGDVILWSDMAGAFAGAALSVTGVDWDDEQNRAYYGQAATPDEVLSGRLTSERAAMLRQKLPS